MTFKNVYKWVPDDPVPYIYIWSKLSSKSSTEKFFLINLSNDSRKSILFIQNLLLIIIYTQAKKYYFQGDHFRNR